MITSISSYLRVFTGILIGCVCLSFSYGQTTTTSAGAWTTAGNWSSGVPGATSVANVNHAMTSISNLSLNSGAIYTINAANTSTASLTINSGTGIVDVRANTTLGAGTFSGGTLYVRSGYTLNLSSATFNSGAVIYVESGATLQINASVGNNASTIHVEGLVYVTGGFSNWTGIIDGNGDFVSVGNMSVPPGFGGSVFGGTGTCTGPSGTPSGCHGNTICTSNTISANQSICPGGSVTAFSGNAIGGYTYQWKKSTTDPYSGYTNIGGATSQNYTPASPAVTTWYKRVATSTCASDGNYVKITVNASPATPTISVTSGSTAFCNGCSVTLSSSSANNNTWSSGQTTQSITVSTAASYTVTVTTSGCSATSAATAVIVNNCVGHTWYGNTNTDWATTSNWDKCSVPGATDDVTIPNPITNQPSISTTATCNNITINNGSTVTNTSTGTLNVKGNFTLNGTGAYTDQNTTNFNGTGGQQVISGTTHFKYLNISNTNGVRLAGNMTVDNTCTISSGTLDFGPSARTVTLLGNLSGAGGISMTGSGIAHTLNLGGTSNSIGTFSTTASSGSTVNYNRAGNQGIFASMNYQNLSISGSGTKTISAATSVNGILTLMAGTLASAGNLTIPLNTGAISGTGAGTITGNITITKTVNSSKYHMISSPLSGRTVNDWNDNVQIKSGSYANLYWYDETNTDTVTTSGWTSITNLTTGLTSLQGYCLYFEGATVIDETGSYTHSTSYSNSSLTNTVSSTGGVGRAESDGWNLMGNPYPSAIDWDAVSGWTKTGLDNAIYFWDPINNRYASYINGASTNGGTRYIPSMQAFWVRVTNPGIGSLALNNNVRVTSTNPSIWRTAAITDMLKLTASNGGYRDEAIIRFTDDATENFDSDWDAYDMLNEGNTPNLYTESGKDQYAINSLPASSKSITIPIKLNAAFTGTYTITAAETESFADSDSIIFEDRLLGIRQNLKTNPAYSANVEEGDTTGRFYLHFRRADNTIISSITSSLIAPEISVRSYEQTVTIKFNNINSSLANIVICNTLGQQLFLIENADIASGEFSVMLPSANTGIYLVKVMTPILSEYGKVFLSK